MPIGRESIRGSVRAPPNGTPDNVPAVAELIPRKILFGNPDRGSPEVAPDGRRLAHLEPVDDVLNVWVGDIGGDAARPVTSDTDRGIRSYTWAADGRHLIYLQDSGGDENWHLHIVDPETGDDRDATPFDGVQARVLGISRRRPGHILVGLNKDNPELHDAYLLDLETGKLDRAAQNPGYYDWLVDNELRPRGGMRMRDDGSGTFELDGATLLELDADDAISSQAIGFTADDSTLYVITPASANAAGLVQVAPGSAPETLADDPTYDVASAELHPVTRTVEIVSFLRARLEHQVLDPAIAPDIDAITALRPGDAFLISRDHADRTWTVGFTADDGPVAYYAFDRGERTGRFLFTQHDDLARYRLSPMEPFSFRARDGLEIHGYLTFPPDAPRQGLPTVIYVHGGPWARDTWGYDPTAQWLANRGYLCVQVNYRGSSGYGKAFLNAGDREWGRKMHEDLIDAVEHVVGAGFSHRSRVGIYGGSYGGYAALVGATFTPDVFRCAVDVVGPSNLRTLLETIPPYWKQLASQFHRRVGHPDRDADLLWERSPLSRAGDIRIPLLIAQGANDPRVKMSESDQIVEALRERGIPHTYLVYPDEGHGFKKPENAMAFQAAAERFLAEHLGGRCEP
jgi:dipeptidyl aminopeptidase/acylaminoacyl peptidase